MLIISPIDIFYLAVRGLNIPACDKSHTDTRSPYSLMFGNFMTAIELGFKALIYGGLRYQNRRLNAWHRTPPGEVAPNFYDRSKSRL